MAHPTPSSDDHAGTYFRVNPDEELTFGDAPWWRSTGRRQALAGGAVTLLLVGAVVAITTAGQTPSSQAPAPSPTGTGVTRFSPIDIDEAALRCPPRLPCEADDLVPPVTDAAVAQYLPGALDRRVVTVTLTDPNRLYYRAVNAIAGPVEVLVLVSIPAAEQSAQTVVIDPRPGASIRYVRRQVGRYEVQVQYTGPPGGTPPVDQAISLALDPRLLAGS